MSPTSELTMPLNAVPTSTATASSMTLPLSAKLLNSAKNPLVLSVIDALYYLFILPAHFLDILLDFLDVLLDLVDVLGLLVDGHLDKYRQINSLQRHDGREYKQHPVDVYRARPRRAEAHRKQDRVQQDRLRRPYPACSRAGCFFDVYFHGVPTENRTLVASATERSFTTKL